MEKKIKPFINIGPGQIIKRNLESLNWSQEDLSEIIGMSPKSISLIMNNKQSITVETALLLGKAFNTSPEFWLNLEQNYRLRLKEEGKKEEETATKAEIRKYMPILEMKKKGWITCDRSTESQIKAYCNFWDQKKIDFSIYKTESLPFCARQGNNHDENYTKYYTATWLNKTRVEAKKIKASDYSIKYLKNLSEKIPDFTLTDDGVGKFIKELNKTGVKFFVLSHLSKTYLDGASFFDNKNPVIVYTARHNRLDNFWWTITHEIAHILLHLKSSGDCFLDNLDEQPVNEKEEEADNLCGTLLNEKKLLEISKPYKNYLSEERLKEVSQLCGLNPSVAMGILQHNKFVEYRTLIRYRKTALNLISDKLKKG